MPIRKASFQENDQVTAVARSSKFTSGFTNIIYSGEENYEKGNIIVMEQRGKIVGMCCLRHCVRKPFSTVYDVAVLPEAKGRGHGKKLVEHVLKTSPHKCVRLNVDCTNQEALDFYCRMGFKKVGEGAWGKKKPKPFVTLELR